MGLVHKPDGSVVRAPSVGSITSASSPLSDSPTNGHPLLAAVPTDAAQDADDTSVIRYDSDQS